MYIGTAGWNIPRAHKARFPAEGSGLQRYSARLNAAEINTSFYRPHAPATYERPKVITHERGLMRAREPLARFLGEIAGLGDRLGPLLIQLPPSHVFGARRAGRFFELRRGRHPGGVVCEPRHRSWTSDAATRLFVKFRIAGVAADPPRAERPRCAGRLAGTHLLSLAWIAAALLLAVRTGTIGGTRGQTIRGQD